MKRKPLLKNFVTFSHFIELKPYQNSKRLETEDNVPLLFVIYIHIRTLE